MIILALVLAFVSCLDKDKASSINDVVIENPQMRLVIGSKGEALSLIHKGSGQECLIAGENTPVFSITQYRPYDNELQLAYPAKRRIFPADSVYREGDNLIVTFEQIKHVATIDLKITDQYIGFTLKKLSYDSTGYRGKIKTPVDEFTLLQLPVRNRVNFGEWLNVVWDEEVAVNVLGTGPYTQIDAVKHRDFHLLQAGALSEVKTLGVGVALITTEKSKLLDCIDQVEQDFKLPRGVRSRRSKEYKYSYYETWDATPQNIDEHIAFARKAGFKAIQVVWTAFSSTIGHFPWRPEYPNGMEDLQTVIRKIKDAGMVAGAHFWYNKAQKKDLYVTPVPDYRLNLSHMFTLASPLNKESTTIVVEESSRGCTMDDNRRILKIGNELIEYSGYTIERPYQFTGCLRGAFNTCPLEYGQGFRLGLLDVDTWPVWVRFDQRTSIQQEVAERIGKIYNEAGFDFVYFDGAEDVPPPYWFNTSMAQLKVYNCLSHEPLFSEGAIKSHFNWHMLSRGNAFDVFKPEVVKEATRKHPAAEAKMIAQDFSSINFGWVNYLAPDSTTICMQPDMYEYVCSRAAAWDCPISLIGNITQLKKHPRTDDNLEVIRCWEEARIGNWFSKEQKKSLQNLEQEHILLKNEKREFELIPYKQIPDVAGGKLSVRAFIFERASKTYVVYWHVSGEGDIQLEIEANKVRLFEKLDKGMPLKSCDKGVIIPVGKRRYLEVDLTQEEVISAFKEAVIL